MSKTTQSTSLDRTCSRQRRATALHRGFSEGSLVQGPELASTSYYTYVQRSTYIRSKYLASRMGEPMLFCLASSCFISQPNICSRTWTCSTCCKSTCIPTSPIDKYLPARCAVHPPYFLLLWVGSLQPQKALLGRIDAPAQAWGKAKHKTEKGNKQQRKIGVNPNVNLLTSGWLDRCLSRGPFPSPRISHQDPTLVSRNPSDNFFVVGKAHPILKTIVSSEVLHSRGNCYWPISSTKSGRNKNLARVHCGSFAALR